MANGQSMAKPDIETQVVADLPDRSDQARNCVRLSKFFLVEHFRHRSHLPFRRPFHDDSSEDIAMLFARKRGGGVEMNRTPIPALRDDPCNARAKTRVADGVRQK